VPEGARGNVRPRGKIWHRKRDTVKRGDKGEGKKRDPYQVKTLGERDRTSWAARKRIESNKNWGHGRPSRGGS